MKNISVISALFILLTTFGIQSCSKGKIIPNGIIIQEERPITGEFHSLSTGDGIDVTIVPSQDGNSLIDIKGDSNILPKIRTELSGGRLYIEYKSGTIISGRPHVEIRVKYTELKELAASGGASISIDGTLAPAGDGSSGISEENNLALYASGGSSIEIERGVIAGYDNVKADISGGSGINILGQCSRFDLVSSGGSTFNGFNFSCEILDANISGGGKMKVTCNEKFYLTASGGSNVEIKGNAKPGKLDLSGGSNIKYEENF